MGHLDILSIKEKLLLGTSYLPWKFSKFCPSYLKEYNNTCTQLVKLGGDISQNQGTIQFNFEGQIYLLRPRSTDFLVFDQVILKNEYQHIVSRINETVSNFNEFKIIDAGANVGFASMYFYKNFPSGQIISLEPDSDNFSQLEKNVGINSMHQRIQPWKAGIWGTDSELSIDTDFRDGREWSLSLKETSDENSTKITAFSLEHILNENKWAYVDFIKIDIEGGEKNLFDAWALNPSSLAKIKFMAIEIHDEIADRKFIHKLLTKNGFSLQEINETTFCINQNLV